MYDSRSRSEGGTSSPAAIRDAPLAGLHQARDKPACYDHLRDKLLAGRSEEEFLRAGDRVGPYLTLMAGHLYEQQNLEWSTIVLDILQPGRREPGGRSVLDRRRRQGAHDDGSTT